MNEPVAYAPSESDYAMAVIVGAVAGTVGGTVGGLIVRTLFDAFLNWLRTI